MATRLGFTPRKNLREAWEALRVAEKDLGRNCGGDGPDVSPETFEESQRAGAAVREAMKLIAPWCEEVAGE